MLYIALYLALKSITITQKNQNLQVKHHLTKIIPNPTTTETDFKFM